MISVKTGINDRIRRFLKLQENCRLADEALANAREILEYEREILDEIAPGWTKAEPTRP